MKDLLDRFAQNFAERAAAARLEFVRLLALGDDAPTGSEDDLVSLAIDLKISTDEVHTLAGYVEEIRQALPTAALKEAHDRAHRELTVAMNEGREEKKRKLEAAESEFKQIFMRHLASQHEGQRIASADRRLVWLRRECADLVAAVETHQGLTRPAPTQAVPLASIAPASEPQAATEQATAEQPAAPESPLTPHAPPATSTSESFRKLKDQTQRSRMHRSDQRSRDHYQG